MPVSIFWSFPRSDNRIDQGWWGLDPVTPPADEPVTLAEVKFQSQQLDSNASYHDDELADNLVAARRHIEKLTNRFLLPQTWDFWLNTWPQNGRLFIPRAPLQSVAWVKYTDLTEAVNTTDPTIYDVNTTGDPGSVVLQFGQIWPPTPLSPSRPINARFTAGYPYLSGSAAAVVNVDGSITLTGAPGDFDPAWPIMTRLTLLSPSVLGNGLPQRIYSVSPSGDSVTLKPSPPWATVTSGTYLWAVNEVPRDLCRAIIILAAHWWNQKEPLPMGRDAATEAVNRTIDTIVDQYRVNTAGFNQMRVQAF